MHRRSLALLLLLAACDDARGPILSLTVTDPGLSQAGSSAGGNGTQSDAGLGTQAGTGGDQGQAGQDTSPAGSTSIPGVDAGLPAGCVPIPPKPWLAIGHPSSVSGQPGDALYNPPEQAVDNDITTRWSTGVGQGGGEWIEIDFGAAVTITRLELDHARNRADMGANPDYPEAIRVSMSDTTRDFGAPAVAETVGTEGFTNVIFQTPGTGRYLFIQQTGVKDGSWWTIHELYAFCEMR